MDSKQSRNKVLQFIINVLAVLTSSKISGVYFGGKPGAGGGVARPLSQVAGGIQLTILPQL